MKKLAIILAACFAITTAQAKDSKKIYISADMEGLVGAVQDGQLKTHGFEYDKYRRIYTREVNAAIEAAFDNGATEILVSDSHGNAQSLLMEELDPRVQLIRGWPRPLMMMQGIDESFDGVILIGYHAGSEQLSGVRAHTMSSSKLTSVKINGVPMSEASLSAAIAGHFDVPVIMVSGDDVVAKETSDMLGDIETAIVKWSIGFHSTRTLLPDAAYAEIKQKTKKAMAKINDLKPYKIKGPMVFDVSFQKMLPVQVLSYLPNVERVGSHTIRFEAKNMIELSQFFQFLVYYHAKLAP